MPSGEWLAQAARVIDEMLWVRDAASERIVYANPAFEQFWGADAARGPGGPLLDLGRRPARSAPLREKAFHTRMGSGQGWVTHIARDISWQCDTTAQLRAEITRRADAERSLNDATQRLGALIATANDAVITIDEGTRIVDWNTAAERIFGWKREAAMGRDLADLIIPPAHREQHRAGLHLQLVRARHLATQGRRAGIVRIGVEVPQGGRERERGRRGPGRNHAPVAA